MLLSGHYNHALSNAGFLQEADFRIELMPSLTSLLKANSTQAALMDKMQTRQELYQLIGYADYERFDRQIAEDSGD